MGSAQIITRPGLLSFNSKQNFIKGISKTPVFCLLITLPNLLFRSRFSETLLHMLKASLGTGILAMPNAFHNAGYVVGIVGTLVIGFLCTYCIHILVSRQVFAPQPNILEWYCSYFRIEVWYFSSYCFCLYQISFRSFAKYSPIQVLMTACYGLIYPHLSYAPVLWGTWKKKSISDRTQVSKEIGWSNRKNHYQKVL